MTPKEKANSLMFRFKIGITDDETAKKFAIIAVDEILNLKMIGNMGRGFDSVLSERDYWTEVKKELIKL